MTDITELAQREQLKEKFEAWLSEKTLYARYMHWCDSLNAYDYTGIQLAWDAYQAGGVELVEALEKAQQYAKERDAENQDLMLTVGRLRVEREGQESRTVKLPGWFVKDAIAVYDRDEIEEALTAAGIKWEAE
ncbi:hypothetical protein [Raoultella terrigena]|uniref:hypothetical protein n=1 Tax=Raoultella terrigena TaxID=577 RepID=UPI0015BF8D2A|nr:hypothetical protein [Raoultella terrigena]NWK87011.1 hypothetical protein [Raoultella terrigena]